MTDMIGLGAELRRLGDGTQSMEAAARRATEYLHGVLVDEAGEPACPLVRLYVTQPLGSLSEPALSAFASTAMGGDTAGRETVPCLVLLATRGQEPQWNDRHQSAGHKAIPLVSAEAVENIPMIAQLLRQLGIDIEVLLRPDSDVVLDLQQTTFNVFHVPRALGSRWIPAQDDFVVPYGIQSVLGFGSMLPSGDLMAAILFSKLPLDRNTAQLFKTLALSVKLALMPHAAGRTFEPAP